MPKEIPIGEFITHSAEETFELAYRIGESLSGGEVFQLTGDLGTGKTIFAKGIGAGLEIDPAEVNSPTFTLINAHTGRLKLYHLDLYRLVGTADDIYDLGLTEMLAEPHTVIVIEWAERLGTFRIQDAFQVSISDLGAEKRQIYIQR